MESADGDAETATLTLNDALIEWPSRENGLDMALSSRPGMTRASSRLLTEQSTENSSPPSRATRSSGRSTHRTRKATAWSSRSFGRRGPHPVSSSLWVPRTPSDQVTRPVGTREADRRLYLVVPAQHPDDSLAAVCPPKRDLVRWHEYAIEITLLLPLRPGQARDLT